MVVRLEEDLEELERFLNRLPKPSEKQMQYLDVISRYSFYLGVFIELTIVILEKSEYIIQYEGLWFRLTFVLFGISMITTKHSIRQWSCFLAAALLGCNSYLHTGRNEILRAVVFIWACYGKDMKKVLKFTFWYTLAGCVVIFLLSVLGIYGNIAQTAVYRAEEAWTIGVEETRFCFGMGHPNSFHCMVLVLTWIGIYCYHEKIKWYGYLVIGILHIVLYSFTVSRTGLLMSVGSLLIFVIINYWKKIQGQKWPYLLGIIVVIGMVGFSVFMAKYSVHHPLLKQLDSVLSGRITNLYYDSINHEGMLNTWSLWSVERNNKYFDLGIIRMFYWYGIVPAVVYFAAQCRLIWCGFKRKDFMLLAMVVIITIYSVFEAHFISDYMGRNYILFFFGMYLADMLGEKNESKLMIE